MPIYIIQRDFCSYSRILMVHGSDVDSEEEGLIAEKYEKPPIMS